MPLFGKKKNAKPAAPSTDDAMEKLNETSARIEKQQAHYQTQIDELNVQIRQKMVAKDRSAARMLLARRKRLEDELKKSQAMAIKIDQQRFMIMGALNNKEVFDAMRIGHQAVKESMGSMTIEAVEDLADDMAEQQEMMDEFYQAMTAGIEDQDAELNDELDRMEMEDLEAQMLNDGASALPALPQRAPASAAPASAAPATEEDEFARLAAGFV